MPSGATISLQCCDISESLAESLLCEASESKLTEAEVMLSVDGPIGEDEYKLERNHTKEVRQLAIRVRSHMAPVARILITAGCPRRG